MNRIDELVALALSAPSRMDDAERKRIADHEKASVWSGDIAAVLPTRLADMVRKIPRSTEAVDGAALWWSSGKRVLLVRGAVGTGKTTAAANVVRLALEPRRFDSSYVRGADRVSWHRPNDFVSAVLCTWDKDAPKLGRELVVIDDVGRETKADFSEAVCTLLDEGTQRVLMTTNLRKAAFAERYDARLIDRLREHGVAVDVSGESMRGRSDVF